MENSAEGVMFVINNFNQAIVMVLIKMADTHIIKVYNLIPVEIILVLPFAQVTAQVVTRPAINQHFKTFGIVAYFNECSVTLANINIKAFKIRRIAQMSLFNPTFYAEGYYFLPFT